MCFNCYEVGHIATRCPKKNYKGGDKYKSRSRDNFSGESSPFGDPVWWVNRHLANRACNAGQLRRRIFIRFGSNARGSRPLVITWLVKTIGAIANAIYVLDTFILNISPAFACYFLLAHVLSPLLQPNNFPLGWASPTIFRTCVDHQPRLANYFLLWACIGRCVSPAFDIPAC